ncbi:MAG: cyclic nucleotide-binding domain-containing protein [Pseudomonadota bacterium]|nr:cyclic nucleotide-binding domain-containing protein [Pseudomonadota bacterium]
MDFLERFSHRHRDRLVGLATTIRLSKGELLLRRGERGGDVFRVAEGELEVIDTRTQPVIVLDVIGRGGVVGEMSFLEDSVRSADVRSPDGAICQRWDRAALIRLLEQEANLAAEFYRVVAGMLVERSRAVLSSAVAGSIGGSGIPRGPTNEVAAADGKALADALRTRLMQLEPFIRRDRAGAERELGAAFRNFGAALGEALVRMSEDDGRIAGEVVASGLHPYVMRSHLGELALDRADTGTVGVPSAMAHLLANKAGGDGPLGEILDSWLLGLPTSRGFRERGALSLQTVLESLPANPPLRILVVNASGGIVPALLAQLSGRMPSELTCVDGNRAALAAVEAASTHRARDIRLRLVQDDLVGLCLGRSLIRHAPQNIVVLDGLLEYLPERLAAAAFRWARGVLAPGGTLVVNALLPSADDPVFRHVLSWPLVRLRPNALVRLLEGAGFADTKVYEVATAGLVGVARRGPELSATEEGRRAPPGLSTMAD